MDKPKKAMDDFIEALENFNDFLENPAEILIDHREDTETYTVTITGLNYVDAHNVVEMGLEYGKSVNIEQEGDDE